MKFSLERTLFVKGLTFVVNAAATKSPIPQLEGVLIEAEGSSLKLIGSNEYSSVFETEDVYIEEPGSTVVNARLFRDIVKNSDGDVVTISADDNRMAIQSGESSFHISVMSPDGYPEYGLDFTKVASATFVSSDLKRGLEEIVYAINEDYTRPVVCGALFEQSSKDGKINIVATDGFRVAVATLPAECKSEKDGSPFKTVLHQNPLKETIKNLPEDTEVLIEKGTRQVRIVWEDSSGKKQIVAKTIFGTFPEWKNFFPKASYIVFLNKNDLLSACGRMGLFISEKLKAPARLKFTSSSVQCSVVTPLGRANDTCKIESNIQDELEIGFNNRYLEDVLKSLKCEKLRIGLVSSSGPCVIQMAEKDEKVRSIHLLLPVRLRPEV